MKQPRWKRILSYFKEIELEAAFTKLNPHLWLTLNKGRYCLTTPNAIYSFSDLYDNFSRTFQRLDLGKYPIQNVLILGFGLGSIPYMLEKVFKRHYHYTGVEADEVIAMWASKYVIKGLNSPIELHVRDAHFYVMACQERFDLVIMDVFQDDEIPAAFQEIAFLEQLGSLLEAGGLLLYNCLADKAEDRRKSSVFYQNSFRKVFPEGTYLDVGGNWMMVNQPV